MDLNSILQPMTLRELMQHPEHATGVQLELCKKDETK